MTSAWPPASVAACGKEAGTATPGGGVRASLTGPLTDESSVSPPVSASRSTVTEPPGRNGPMSVRMPPRAWNPIVSAGATGTDGGASGR